MSETPKKKKKRYPYFKKCRVCGLRKNDGVIIHKTPRNEKFREKWIKATNKMLTLSTVICSNHFKNSDYKVHYGKKSLKAGSVPSVNLDGENVRKTGNDTFSKTSQRLSSCETSNLSDKQDLDDSDSEDLSSSQTYENSNSEEEICYIYYLDEKQNVRYYQTTARSDDVEGICSESSDSNQVGNPSNIEERKFMMEYGM